MTTVVIMWGENGYAPKPVGTKESVEAAKEWCQWQANHLAGDVLPMMDWAHYLSRGTGPGTAHYTAQCPDGAFEVWVVGNLD